MQVDAAIEKSKKASAPAEARKHAEALDKAGKGEEGIENAPRPMLTPQAEALSPGNNPGAVVDSGALAPMAMKPMKP